jgi:hypothetical protein
MLRRRRDRIALSLQMLFEFGPLWLIALGVTAFAFGACTASGTASPGGPTAWSSESIHETAVG